MAAVIRLKLLFVGVYLFFRVYEFHNINVLFLVNWKFRLLCGYDGKTAALKILDKGGLLSCLLLCVSLSTQKHKDE